MRGSWFLAPRCVLLVGLALASACAGPTPAPHPTLPPHRPDARPALPAAPTPLPDDTRCEVLNGRNCYARIPGGRFRRGAQSADPAAPHHDPQARPDEAPVHEVEVPTIRLMRFEVDVTQARACVAAGWCDPAQIGDAAVRDPSTPAPDRAVTGLSWPGAVQLCGYLGGRLPTEAEWEHAARGTDGRVFPWGQEPRCGRRTTTQGPELQCAASGVAGNADLRGFSPVGDLQGLAGNVWEWVEDGYDPAAYRSAAPVDPRGPADAPTRVQRGGGWLATDVWELRSAGRGSLDPKLQLPDVGVRCARDEAP